MASAQFHGGDSTLSYDTLKDPPRQAHLLRVPQLLQYLSGQMPLPMPQALPAWLHSIGWLLTRLYCGLVLLSSLHLALLFTKTTLDALPTGQLDAITDALTMTIIYYFTAYATTYWLVRTERLLNFYALLNKEHRHHSLVGVCFVSSHAAYEWTRNFAVIWMVLCLGGVLLMGITPLTAGSHTLPLRCWYPFDALAHHLYALVYATQLAGQINVGATFSVGGTLFVGTTVLLLGQFDVLYCSLKNMDAHARLLAGHSLNELRGLQSELLANAATCELNQYMLLEEHPTNVLVLRQLHQQFKGAQRPHEVTTALHAALVECVRLHRFVLLCCAQLEELFNPYCLIKSLQITVQLCLLMFVGVSGTREPMRIINQFQYLVLTLAELLMFTYCGELLRAHSVRAGEAFFRSGWWREARSIRQDLLIFLTNSRRSVQITAGKFYVMDVSRLRSVITQAFSFLTLLQKLDAKKKTAQT